MVDPFHVIANSNKRMDEARRTEQDVYRKREAKIRKKILLIGKEKLGEEKKQRAGELLGKIIFNLKLASPSSIESECFPKYIKLSIFLTDKGG